MVTVRDFGFARRWLSRSSKTWERFPLSLKIGIAILAFWTAVSFVGPFLTPYGFAQLGSGSPLSGASLAHPFGVDQLGRDVLSRVVYGGHIVLALALASTSLGAVLGTLIGLLSVYLGGWIDEIVQRVCEALICIPFKIFGLIALAAAGPELSAQPILIVLVVGILYTPRMARMAPAAAIDIITRDFVTAARLRGERAWSVVRHDLFPNVIGPLLVEFSVRAGYAPVVIASFSFLGFGLRPPTPEWGLLITENRSAILVAPSVVLGPCIALASLVVGLNLFTEGLARVFGRTARHSEQ